MPIRTKKFRVQDGGGSPPPAFCSNFTSALLTSNWQTTNFDVPTQNFDLAQPVSQFTFLVAPSDQAWQATSGDVSFELETNSASGSPSAYGLSILDETQGINIAGFTYENNGDLRDVVSGSPISAGNTIQAGLNCGMRFTASTTGSQAAEVYDNAGNSVAVPLTVDPAYNPYNELKLVISCGTATTATLNFDLNFGTKAFVLPQSNGTYCNQVFVPPAVCTEIDLFLNRFGAAQTINITDNSVEAISTGNAGVTDVMTGTGSEARFTTSTDEVKFETTLDAVSSATNAANYQVGFFDFAQGLLVAGVSVTPNPGVGTLFDIVNGVPIANVDPIEAGYINAPYLDPAGTASYKDNNGIDIAIGVDPMYTNANEITEAVIINAGSVTSDSIQTTVNAGSQIFSEGEDAERWCNT